MKHHRLSSCKIMLSCQIFLCLLIKINYSFFWVPGTWVLILLWSTYFILTFITHSYFYSFTTSETQILVANVNTGLACPFADNGIRYSTSSVANLDPALNPCMCFLWPAWCLKNTFQMSPEGACIFQEHMLSRFLCLVILHLVDFVYILCFTFAGLGFMILVVN